MKLLLTSGGISNASIEHALKRLCSKPLAECKALCIPTAEYGHPMCTPASAWRFVAGRSSAPMVDLGWQSVGLLELTALQSIGRERWEPWVREADVFLVDGGDACFLAHWMKASGLADALAAHPHAVWVGMSAGSMVMTPRIGREFMGWEPPDKTDRTLGWVNFAIFPHLGHPSMPENTLAAAEKWAAEIGCPAYAIDDQTAIAVSDGVVEVISEGNWRHFG